MTASAKTPENRKVQRVYVLAGEPSGDAHAARVIAAARRHQPLLEVRAMGGDALEAEGAQLVEHVRNTAIMGFVEVLARWRFLRHLFQRVQADILDFQPDRILLVDYPGFNLRMARWAKEHGLPVDMYISPQVWAWKRRRVHRIARDIDRLSVILPFETKAYDGLPLEVEYVGHPLMETLSESPEIGGADSAKWRLAHGLPEGVPLLALLPGSRPQEIQRMLPVLSEAAKAFPDHQPVVAGAPGRRKEDYRTEWPVLFGATRALYRHAEGGIVTSGTATLEAALSGMPQVVAYRTSPLTYRIAKAFSKVKYISLVNLILDREAVPERIQHACQAPELIRTLRAVLSEDGQNQQREDQRALRQSLSKSGASEQVAHSLLRPV